MVSETEVDAAAKALCCPYPAGCVRDDDCFAMEMEAKHARAALDAAERVRAAEGYVIVPIDPTGEMLDAGAATFDLRDPTRPSIAGQPSKAYRAMIAARPRDAG
jgi:hypothetical protein